MAELLNKIQADAITARKAMMKGDRSAQTEAKARALVFLIAEIQSKMKSNRVTEISDPDTVVQIRKLRKEAECILEDVKWHPERKENVELEIAVWDEYIPVPLSADAIYALANAAISDLGATSQKDMGAVMRECLTRNPMVDRTAISTAIKSVLTKNRD